MLNIIINGDKSRYQFLRYLMNEEHFNNMESLYNTELLSTETYHVISDKNNKLLKNSNYLYSMRIPLNTEVVFPTEYQYDKVEYKRNDRILFFDEFPYRTDKKIEELKKYVSCQCCLEIILVKNERRTLDTDISTIESALKLAEKEYKDSGYMVEIWTPGKRDILYWKYVAGTSKINLNMQKQIEDIQYQIGKEGESDSMLFWDYSLGYVCKLKSIVEDPNRRSLITEYKKIYNGKNIIEQYNNHAIQFWRDNENIIYSFINKLYSDLMIKICFWNMEDDLKELDKYIFTKYKQILENSNYKLVFCGTESEYYNFLKEKAQVVQEYMKKITDFFQNGLRNTLREYIIERLSILEEISNETIH